MQFNPAALLSLGDARAFLEALSTVKPRPSAVPRGAWHAPFLQKHTFFFIPCGPIKPMGWGVIIGCGSSTVAQENADSFRW